jgi:hypothetical protein
VDSSSNVIIGGIFAGSLDFGCGLLTAVGEEDIFLVKLNSSGTCTWSKSFGIAGQTQTLDSVAVDGAANVVVGGIAYGGVNFGGGATTGYFIAKFGPTGTFSWSDGFAASCDESIPMLAVDGDANVILAGCFVGSVNFGGGDLTNVHGSAFVAKFDASGGYLWANQYGNGAESGAFASDVAVDGCGNIFVTGNFGGLAGNPGTINFGTGALTGSNPNAEYAFLAKLDPTGAGVWSEQFDSTTSVDALGAGSIAVDGAGGPITTYGLNGSVSFGGSTLTSTSGGSVAIASFNADGAYRWSYSGGPPSTAGSNAGDPNGIAANGATLAVVGAFGGSGTTLELPGKTLTAVSDGDTFLTSFAP